jgi:hypothetical protein
MPIRHMMPSSHAMSDSISRYIPYLCGGPRCALLREQGGLCFVTSVCVSCAVAAQYVVRHTFLQEGVTYSHPAPLCCACDQCPVLYISSVTAVTRRVMTHERTPTPLPLTNH